MKIQKSAEDYLEAMLMMKEEHGYIRSIDIATKLGVTKPSVSYATKRLRENGLYRAFFFLRWKRTAQFPEKPLYFTANLLYNSKVMMLY